MVVKAETKHEGQNKFALPHSRREEKKLETHETNIQLALIRGFTVWNLRHLKARLLMNNQ